MQSDKHLRSRRRAPRMWLPYFVLALVVAATAAIAANVRASAEANDRLRFENAVQRTEDNIRNRLETYVGILRAGAGLFAADREVSRDEFRRFVERIELQKTYPGIQGVGYSARVAPQDREGLVAAMHAQGFPDFQIRPEGERPEYTAIIYVEPVDRRNRAAVGFDMFSEPMRRAAMERARDTGMPAASGRVRLIQELDPASEQAGFLIYVPVYHGGSVPATVDERRSSLRGFVYAPFRADDLLRGIFGGERNPLVDFRVYDGTNAAPASLMHRSDLARGDAVPDAYAPRFTTKSEFDVEGRTWSIAFFTRRDGAVAVGDWGWLLVALVGPLFGIALFFVTRSQVRARALAEAVTVELRASESRFRTLVEQSPVSTQILSPDGRTLRVNRAWEELWGVTLEALGDYNLLTDPQLEEKGIATFIRRGFAGEPTAIPPILYDPEESIPGITTHADPRRWVSARIYPVKDEEGRVREVVLIHEDISERVRAEEALREQTEVVETVNRVGQLLTSELDLQKVVQGVTDAATELTGARFGSFFYNVLDEQGASYTLYTLSGVPRHAFENFPMPRATDLFGPTFRGEGTVRIADVKLDPRYGKNSPYFGLPEGHLPVKSYLAVPVVSRSGEVLGGLFFGHPEAGVFGERHARMVEGLAAQAAVAVDNARLFKAAERARLQAEEASRLKDEFLATLSHELRTPLTAVLGWAKLLRSEPFDAALTTRALEAIERNAVAQTRLINDLLDVSRIITGKLRLDMRPVELAAVVEAAVETVRPAAHARGVRLDVRLDAGAGPVAGDADRLQQVVWNLLSNAIKFTPQGGSVGVRLARKDTEAGVVVSDTGRGIAPEFLPHVFD
ncbi:MAG: hypothetical protein QOJ76_926, partial [Acidobacteriota bacterium]|nr:hypothetical protein [Acidobacteriota bacterium]